MSRHDIAQILRSLRKAARGGREEIVITAGEILRDEEIESEMALQDRDADTKVRTAISWLERAGFIQREENVTSVFQARLLVTGLAEAEGKIAALNLSGNERALWMGILREFINAGPTENLTVDRLALLPEFKAYAQAPGGSEHGIRGGPEYLSARILKILSSMVQAGLMKRDTLLNAFVRHKVADHSRVRLDRILQLDRKMMDLLALEAPDPEGWMPLSLRPLNQRLCDEGFESSTELLRALLKSLSEDGRGFAGMSGSIDLRYASRDTYRVRVRRNWTAIGELAEKRRRAASLVLDAILAKIPPDTPPRADLLVEFSFEELHQALERDLVLRSELKDINAALERALMYLHEQRVIVLQQGLAVFRSAMTIRLQPGTRGEKYKTSDYQPLEHHYRERTLQVHVMSEYARRGLERIREALSLVLAYFTLNKEEFIQRYLGTKPDLLQHATTAQSFQRIVTDLGNPAQIKLVTAPTSRNMLILAGPGSGKTRTVVHRCAYLLRIQRVRPQSVLVCCFNRQAAIELRRRLSELVGNDARGVTVLTYHGLAMRLLGCSMAGRAETRAPELDFDALISDAVELLKGERVPPGLEPDEVRDRLLAGFQHILVDEYQDIDAPQYEMISAIAGRKLDDPEQKLSILAVGDDDQNIYSFRGANLEFIRRFQRDYDAEIHYLVENYRSTRHIIEAANDLIAANTDRMKSDHRIRIDRHRQKLPPGGEFGQRDELSRGRVQVIQVRDSCAQARAVLAEIRRLKQMGVSEWSHMAVLSSTHRDLAQVRAMAERENIPIRWGAGQNAIPPLHRVHEICDFLRQLAPLRHEIKRASELGAMAALVVAKDSRNPWLRFLQRMLESWRIESDDAELPIHEALEFLYETCAESRRDLSFGEGVSLSTVHAAKGTEYEHVLLVGPWPLSAPPARREESRRTFYVGMTRARQSLTIFDRRDVRPSLPATMTSPDLVHREYLDQGEPTSPVLDSYAMLGLEDINLSYPGYYPPGHPIHAALAGLRPGDQLVMRPQGEDAIGLRSASGLCVARLSQKGKAAWANRLDTIREIRVVAMVRRGVDQQVDPAHARDFQVSEWEVPIAEIVFEEGEENWD